MIQTHAARVSKNEKASHHELTSYRVQARKIRKAERLEALRKKAGLSNKKRK